MATRRTTTGRTSSYSRLASTKATPQSEMARPDQVKNRAGGYVFKLNPFDILQRFLILGVTSNTYYATRRQLVVEDILPALRECLKIDGVRTVETIVNVSEAGRAKSNDPAIFALLLCSAEGDESVKQAAHKALTRVCRTGTHVLHAADQVKDLRGWGSGLRRAFARWFEGQKAWRLATQMLKYQSRDGMSMVDLLNLSHPTPPTEEHDRLFRYFVDRDFNAQVKSLEAKTEIPIVDAVAELHKTDNLDRQLELIQEHRLQREMVPTELLSNPKVWEVLLPNLGFTALIRNLGNLSKVGLLVPFSEASKTVIARLGDLEALKGSRVHPIQMLAARVTYAKGRGYRGSGTWSPVPQVVDALENALYQSFNYVEPTGKNFYLGVDISGSMYGAPISGLDGIDCATGAAVMALTTAKTESNYVVRGFTHGPTGRSYDWRVSHMEELGISAGSDISHVYNQMRKMSSRMGGTNCAQPMLDALNTGLHDVDVFVVYTDCETWAGRVHPFQALKEYRNKTGKDAKLVVVGMCASQFTIADPNDPGMLDVVGFDSNAPAIISSFARGEV